MLRPTYAQSNVVHVKQGNGVIVDLAKINAICVCGSNVHDTKNTCMNQQSYGYMPISLGKVSKPLYTILVVNRLRLVVNKS